jgi:hypothetical protein
VTHSTSRSWTRPICSATSNASAGLVEAEPRIEPGERLDRQQVLVALEPPDRLEHGAHRALGDGVAQRLRALAGDQRDVLRDLGEPDRHLAAAALGLVEGPVGLLAQDLGVVARPQLGGADADRHLAVAQRGHEPPRGGQGARLAGAREQQAELVAADPEGAVALAAAAQHLGDAAQQLGRIGDAGRFVIGPIGVDVEIDVARPACLLALDRDPLGAQRLVDVLAYRPGPQAEQQIVLQRAGEEMRRRADVAHAAADHRLVQRRDVVAADRDAAA